MLQHEGTLRDSGAEDPDEALRSTGNGIINTFLAKRLHVCAFTRNKIGAEVFSCTWAAPV